MSTSSRPLADRGALRDWAAGAPPGRSRGSRRTWRLGVATRRTVLVAHIASAGSWLGVDVAMAVLIVTAMLTSDVGTQAFCLQALELVAVWPLLACGLVCLLTGIVLGLGEPLGRAPVLVGGDQAGAQPGPHRAGAGLPASRGDRAGRAGPRVLRRSARHVRPDEPDLPALTVSPALLLIAMTLSVVKPWGRITRAPR